MNGPDGLPGDLEIFMDFGLGPEPHGPMPPFMEAPSSAAPATPPQNVGDQNQTAAASASDSSPNSAPREDDLSDIGFTFPATAASGTALDRNLTWNDMA